MLTKRIIACINVRCVFLNTIKHTAANVGMGES
jgi:hypothetical protein